MPENDYDKARRSSRVFMRVRVVVAGKNSDNRRFREACETIVINAHGGLMYLNMVDSVTWELDVREEFHQWDAEGHRIYNFRSVHYFRNCYGFPLPAFNRFATPSTFQAKIKSEFELFPAIFDGFTALFILYLIVRISEWLIRRREGRKP